MVVVTEREPEVIVAELRPSAGVLVVPSLLLIAAAAAVGYFAFRLEVPWQRWGVIGGGVLVFLFGFLLPLWAWAARRITITTRRTVLRRGMFAHHRREVLHSRVLEVALHRSAAQRIAGSGDVRLELGQGQSAVLRGVRSPRLVQAALSDLVDAQRDDPAFRRLGTGEVPPL